MDAYWAKDIQELSRLERRSAFQKLTELLMVQSGAIFEARPLAGACGISQPTVENYVSALEETLVIHILRPFHGNRSKEIITAPKIYGCDTGFVCFYRGWTSLRPQDVGALWEHLVLNELHAVAGRRTIRYWRDKQKHEIDFIWAPRGSDPVVIECQWSAADFDPGNLGVFRRVHPNGVKVVVSHDVHRPCRRTWGGLVVHFENPRGLAQRIEAWRGNRGGIAK